MADAVDEERGRAGRAARPGAEDVVVDVARVAALSLAGVEASFADAATKARLRAGIADWLAAPPQVAMSTKRE